jgi:DNA-binding CsgD family transcriptional regulator
MLLDNKSETVVFTDDPREPREIVKAINTGAWLPGDNQPLEPQDEITDDPGDFDLEEDSEDDPAGESRVWLQNLYREHSKRRAAKSPRPSARHWAVGHEALGTVLVVPQPPPVALTPRHYDVLFRLSDGQAAKEIARDLGISRRTVYLYTSELKERFGAQSRIQLLAMAVSAGIISRFDLFFF